MGVEEPVLVAVTVGVGLVLAFLNVTTTRLVWASPMFETSQKVAQTVLIWFVPLSVFVVWNVVRSSNRRGAAAGSPADLSAAATDWVIGDGGHHGAGGDHGGGGHHGGFDGGGHHGGFDGGGGFGGHH